MVIKIRLSGQKHECWLIDLTIYIYSAKYTIFSKQCILKIDLDKILGRAGGEYTGVGQRQKVVHTTNAFYIFFNIFEWHYALSSHDPLLAEQ